MGIELLGKIEMEILNDVVMLAKLNITNEPNFDAD